MASIEGTPRKLVLKEGSTTLTLDKDSGKELWTVKLAASAHAAPMTYLGGKTKKQFVVIAVGGGNKYNKVFSDELVAFALP